jgi:hypothetical protein
METIKMKQTKTLELKNTTEVKNLLEFIPQYGKKKKKKKREREIKIFPD